MAFEIRNATRADLPVCAKILLQEFNRVGEHWSPSTAKARVLEVFEAHPELCFCLVLDGKVIGMLFGQPFGGDIGRRLYLLDFAVESGHQGKGFGLKALCFIEGFAKEKGFKSLLLDTNQRKKAIKIYEKFGFKKTNYVIMDKKL